MSLFVQDRLILGLHPPTLSNREREPLNTRLNLFILQTARLAAHLMPYNQVSARWTGRS